MSKESFSHQFVDYAAGRKNPPQLTVMVGPAGSGKSTVAKAWVNWGQGKVIRFNRDSLRSMLFGDSPWNHRNEDFVRKYEENGVRLALSRGLSAIVDDTNCTARRRLRWERMARASRAAFDLVLMNASEKECIERNKGRTGKECVPEEAIRRQFQRLREAPVVPAGYEIVAFNRAVCDWQALLATGTGDGLVLRLPEAQVVFCDVDGTLADHEGVRDQYDESKVLLDRCREPVAAWLRALYPTHNIIIVSGRHDTCCADTCDWLEASRAPFDFIFMRPAGSDVSDHIVKQNILDAVLAWIPKDRIAFAIDDRPKVVEQVWRANGIKAYPVGGTIEHSATCPFEADGKGWRRCPGCGALEDF